MKYRVGDKVKVVKDDNDINFNGAVGEIVKILTYNDFKKLPYCVVFEKPIINALNKLEHYRWYNDHEITLINRGNYEKNRSIKKSKTKF